MQTTFKMLHKLLAEQLMQLLNVRLSVLTMITSPGDASIKPIISKSAMTKTPDLDNLVGGKVGQDGVLCLHA